jgi:predicted AAA+ superfamily ATPase
MYRRDIYLEQLIKLKGSDPVKVITGVRRCGKSTLLDLFEDRLLKNKTPKKSIIRIIRINFELSEFDGVRDYRDLITYINSQIARRNLSRQTKATVMLDEVQLIPGWERAVNSLRAGRHIDLYITGSNASMLSSELATLLSGRYLEIKMTPFSFKEYLEFRGYRKTQGPADGYFNDYMAYGGFPELHEMNQDENLIRSFLSGIYNTDYEGVRQRNIIEWLLDV